MFSVICVARTSRAPRKTPGKASTLLIWFGKSLRPVATTAAYLRATSGWTSGLGLAIAQMMALSAMVATTSSGTSPADRPTNTSAPASADSMEPCRPALLLMAASSALYLLSPGRPS